MDFRERLDRQLVEFSSICERSIPIAQGLYAEGLRLLGSEYGGLIDRSAGLIDPEVEEFEKELLRERYGTWSVYQNGLTTKYGYRSRYIDELLAPTGLQRDDLLSLGRGAQADMAIERQPWAKNYHRNFLSIHRTTGAARTEEQERERCKFGLTEPNTRSMKRYVSSAIERKLKGLGFEPVRRSYREANDVYSNRGKAAGVAMEFALDVDSTPITSVPIMVRLMAMPVLDVQGCDEVFKSRFERGDFFEIIEPYVPNFGAYRTAWSPGGVEMLVHAYGMFLDAVVPSIEDVCRKIGT